MIINDFDSQFNTYHINSVRDIWDNERHDFITSIELWSKVKVKSNWISEWMLIKEAVPDSLMCALKHDNIISNSDNDLKLVNLKLYEHKGKLILPDELKTKVRIKQHLAQQFREHLKTETINSMNTLKRF